MVVRAVELDRTERQCPGGESRFKSCLQRLKECRPSQFSPAFNRAGVREREWAETSAGEDEAIKVWNRTDEGAVVGASEEGPEVDDDGEGPDLPPAREGGVQRQRASAGSELLG